MVDNDAGTRETNAPRDNFFGRSELDRQISYCKRWKKIFEFEVSADGKLSEATFREYPEG